MLKQSEKYIIKERWSQEDKIVNDFYSFEPVRKYMLTCLSGNESEKIDNDWMEKWRVDTYLSDIMPVEKCLSICCGFGFKERILSKFNVFSHCTAIDLSEKAIREAHRLAEADNIYNIEYLKADIENITLEKKKYDLVYASGALHHIKNLEHVISLLYDSLRPGGILLSDEYVGPSYNQLTKRHREIINSVIHIIPKTHRYAIEHLFVPEFFRFRSWRRVLYELSRLIMFKPFGINFEIHDISKDTPYFKKLLIKTGKNLSKAFLKMNSNRFKYGKLWDVYPKIANEKDPSEGIRSNEIIPIIKKTFGKNVEIKYYNCSILHYALDNKFFKAYNPESQEDRQLFDMIVNIEKIMIERGEIPPILAHIFALKN
jgi:ubiquinone/menaquinone biosynthesis C-methylase UbiE